jgi:hypothetical protein
MLTEFQFMIVIELMNMAAVPGEAIAARPTPAGHSTVNTTPDKSGS